MSKGSNNYDLSLDELKRLPIKTLIYEIAVLRSWINDLLGDAYLLENPHPNESFEERVKKAIKKVYD